MNSRGGPQLRLLNGCQAYPSISLSLGHLHRQSSACFFKLYFVSLLHLVIVH